MPYTIQVFTTDSDLKKNYFLKKKSFIFKNPEISQKWEPRFISNFVNNIGTTQNR